MSVIRKIYYGDRVKLKGKISNPTGATGEICVKRQDGKDLKPGKSEVNLTVSVDAKGDYNLELLIENAWEWHRTPNKYDKLIATITYEGQKLKSSGLEVYPKPQIIVDFRRDSGYDGKYGFDWFREKRDGVNDYNDIFTGDINDLMDEYQQNPLLWFNTKYDWHNKWGPTNNKERKYLQSYLTLYPKKSIKLSIIMDVFEVALEDLELEYDKKLFTITPETLPIKGKGENQEDKDFLLITCNNEFSKDKKIEVKSNKRLLGVLNIMANNKSTHRFEKKILFINVTSDLTNSGVQETANPTGRETELKKYLAQALIKPENDTIETVELDVSILDASTSDGSANIEFNRLINDIQTSRETEAGNNAFFTQANNILYANFDTPTEEKYRDHLKIYFIDEVRTSPGFDNLCGQARATPSNEVIVLRDGLNDSTLAHEAFHAMGLHHSFDNTGKNKFEEDKTDNIMDYSDVASVAIPVVSTWRWQWKDLQKGLPNES